MNYEAMRRYFSWANAVYGSSSNTTPIAVGSSRPIPVQGFTPTQDSGFDGALYKDPTTGKYVLAFAGSVQPVADWLTADSVLAVQRLTQAATEWAGSWHSQMTDAMNFAYAAVKQIRFDLQRSGIDDPTMDQIREKLSVTGHSLGGALAEMAAKLFGLPGANIDGPGVSGLTQTSNFSAMIDKIANDPNAPAGFNRNYTMQPGEFIANAFSIVGVAGEHLEGTNFAAEPKASSSFYVGSTLVVAGVVAPAGAIVSLAGLGILGNSIADHPMGNILRRIEIGLNLPSISTLPPIDAVGLGGVPYGGLGLAPEFELYHKLPSITTYAVAVQWIADQQNANVASGLSPSGIALDGTATQRGGYTAIAFKDPETGRINEVYTPSQGGTPVKREFAVAADGQVATLTLGGGLQILVQSSAGIGVVNLSPDNKLSFLGLNIGKDDGTFWSLDAQTAQQLRSGGTSLQNLMQELANKAMGDFSSATNLQINGQSVSAFEIERNGLTYTRNAAGGYERNLGQGQADVFDENGNRYVRHADGTHTPVSTSQEISISDSTGFASVAERAPISLIAPNNLPQIIVANNDGTFRRDNFNAYGQRISQDTLQIYDDGSAITTTTLPNGTVQVLATDPTGAPASLSITSPSGANLQTIESYTFAGGVKVLQTRTVVESLEDATGTSRIETVTSYSAAGVPSTVRNVYNNDNTLFSSEPVAQPSSGLTNLQGSEAANAVNDLLQFGQLAASGTRPAAYVFASGLTLLNRNFNPTDNQGIQRYPNFGTAATVAQGALSLYNLGQAFSGSGSDLARLSATGSAINFVNQTFYQAGTAAGSAGANSLNTALSGGQGGLLGGTPGILPAIGLISAIKAKDPIGIVQGAIGLFNPALLFTSGVGFTPLGWILIGVSILRIALAEGPPKAWGVANVSYGAGFDNLALQVNASGESFGKDKARQSLQGIATFMQERIDAINARQAAGQQVGLIAQRMPGLAWRASDLNDSGFNIVDIDPLTGEQKYPYRRFDDSGVPFSSNRALYQVDLSDPQQRGGLNDAMLRAASRRGAIAPLWEVQTAKLQGDAGVPDAGLSEEERAAKHGLGAALDTAYAAAHAGDPAAKHKRIGSFMAVGLDLDGSGSISTHTMAGNAAGAGTITFNWDNQGYQKEVGSIDANDGYLVLDRDFNQSVDNGTELLSNPLVADPAKGLRSLAGWDTNGDGKIDANDPLYSQLRVWQDFDHDGNNTHTVTVGSAAGAQSYLAQDERTDASGTKTKELRSLSELGITAIDFANNRYEFDSGLRTSGVASGQIGYASARTVTLEAAQEGTLYTPVGAGIRIDDTSGTSEILITQIQSEQAVYDSIALVTADETIGTAAAPLFEDGSPGAHNPANEAGGDAYQYQTLLAWGDSITGVPGLLDNDTSGGAAGQAAGLTISAVSGGTHLHSLELTAEGNVRYSLDANYHGEAGFDYEVTNAAGQTSTAHVTLNVTPVNDAPVVSAQLDVKDVYGYGVRVVTRSFNFGVGSFNYTSVEPGVPIIAPYFTVKGYRGTGGKLSASSWETELVDVNVPLSYFQSLGIAAGQNYVVQTGYNSQTDVGSYVRIPSNPETVLHDSVIARTQWNDGTVTASNPDGPSSYTYERISGGTYGQTAVNAQTGRFEYTGLRYVDQDLLGRSVGQNIETDDAGQLEVGFNDVITIRAIAADGSYIDQDITVPHFGPAPNPNIASSGGKKPIAVDLNGDGFHFTDVDDSNVFFDVNGDGWKRKIAWNNPQDGLLTFDKNGDGKIDRFDEIGFVAYAPDGQTDLEALKKAFDTNRNGVLDAGDAQWAKFGVWQDANSNGINEAGELRSLTDMGISQIGLTSDGQFEVINGQTVHGTATATLTTGSTLAVADVTLRYRDITQVTTTHADGSTSTSQVAVPSQGRGTEFAGTADKDLVFGTNANDYFSTGAGDDVIVDDLGDDLVEAGAGADMIYSGAGNDVINAGAGGDTVFAGTGNDVVFGDGDGTDGVAGDDLLMLEDGNDVAFGGAGNDFLSGGAGNDAITGDAGDDKLFGEDGWDALFGGTGNDELWGMDGNDLLDAGDGSDVLAGGAGDDVMQGGAGDDTYEVDSAADVVDETVGGGIDGLSGTGDAGGVDTVRSSIHYTLGGLVENLTLTGEAALTGTGNAADNHLVGNAAGNALHGLAGNDVLDGAQGADILVGGNGDDTYMVDNANDAVTELAGEGNDTVRSRVSYYLADQVENLTLIGINAINGAGNAADNTLTGNAAGNALDGGAGNDTLQGGAGNDSYIFGRGYGIDTVIDRLGQNALLFGAGIAAADLRFSLGGANGTDLLIDVTASGAATGDRVVLQNWYRPVGERTGAQRVSSVRFADGLSVPLDESALNHAPTVVVDDAALSEDTAQVAGNVLANDSDIDVGNVLSVVGAGTLVGQYGTLVLAADGSYDYHLRSGDADIQGLQVGQTVQDSFTYQVTDSTRFETATLPSGLTITVSGVNDIPVLAQEIQAQAATEIVAFSLTLPAGTFTDVDAGDTLTLSAALANGGALPSWLSFDAATRTFSGEPAYEDITAFFGEQPATLSLRVTATDSQGASASSVFSLTVNQSPELTVVGTDGADTLRGASRNDQLLGGGGDDTMRGMRGDDLLDGGTGADQMLGGLGNDSYVVDNTGDHVVELAGEGADSVNASISYSLMADVENLTLTGADAISGTGNALDNTLVGNAAANALDGGTGADRMLGGMGNDSYVVDNTGDHVVELAGEGDDSVTASIDYSLTDNVERLTLTGNAIQGTGNALANTLTGNAQANLIDGGLGADAMAGGTGNDSYVVDNAGDLVIELANAGTDSVSASINYTLTADVENLTLTGADAISGTGNGLDNTLVGNAAANTLDGGGGADQMQGGLGNDSYLVDNTGDLVTEFLSQGYDQASSSINYVLPEYVEQLTLTGSAVTATGNTQDNTLYGNTLANLLDGAGGADQMAGGLGDDRYIVDNAGDTVIEAPDQGNDTVYASVDYTSAANVENLVLTGTALTATGNALNNVLVGNASANTLSGGEGHDLLAGWLGNDQLRGGEGDDTLDGGDGNDLLDGGNGADALWAGADNDSLSGGNQGDLLAGGAGDDSLDGGNGNDVIVGGSGNDSIWAGNDGDFVDAGSGNDIIDAGNGSDFIAAGKGSDSISAGLGVDVVAFNRGDGQDTILTQDGEKDTLSLGGGIRYADLTLSKTGNDLVLGMGQGDQITLKDWYLGSKGLRKNIGSLQMVTAATGGDYNAASSDRLLRSKVVAFDFGILVQRFDQARTANPALANWSATSSLNAAYQQGSNTSAIGGDISYRYATLYNATAGYGDLDWKAVRSRSAGLGGNNWQTLTASTTPLVNPWIALQAGTSLVLEQPAGASTPITTVPALTQDQLVIAAMGAQQQLTGQIKPSWL